MWPFKTTGGQAETPFERLIRFDTVWIVRSHFRPEQSQDEITQLRTSGATEKLT